MTRSPRSPDTAFSGRAALHTRHTYTLFGEIASGGMASVRLARQLGPGGLSRIVAVKKLHARCAEDTELVAMFRDEIRVASRVIHPNVVPMLDVLAAGDELLLVMDYVHGESVSRLLRSCPEAIPARIACTIMVGVLHGLHAAHTARSERGEPLHIIHRDVTPQNIVVGVDGSARLLDFGIAHAVGRMQTTRFGQVKGKLAYVAPEQLLGHSLDRRVDIYAAAVTLWEMLTGRRLFDGRNPASLAQMILHEHVEAPSVFQRDLSPALDAIVLKALQRNSRFRHATAREMAIALEQETETVSATVLGDWVSEVWGMARVAREQQLRETETEEGTAYLVRPVSPLGARHEGHHEEHHEEHREEHHEQHTKAYAAKSEQPAAVPDERDDQEEEHEQEHDPLDDTDVSAMESTGSTVPLGLCSTVPLALLQRQEHQNSAPVERGVRQSVLTLPPTEAPPSSRPRSWSTAERALFAVLAVAALVVIVQVPDFVRQGSALMRSVPMASPAAQIPRPAHIEPLSETKTATTAEGEPETPTEAAAAGAAATATRGDPQKVEPSLVVPSPGHEGAAALPPAIAAEKPPESPRAQERTPASAAPSLSGAPVPPQQGAAKRRGPPRPEARREARTQSATRIAGHPKPPSAVARPSARTRRPANRASGPQTPTAPDCTPPFVIDAAGVKHFKLACL